MLYHLNVGVGSSLSVPEVKALFVFLMERDGACPPKHQQRDWLAALNAEARALGLLPDDSLIRQRSSAPVDVPTITACSAGVNPSRITVLALIDSDVRITGIPFDFLDNVWFRFRDGPVEINGLTDEDWILLRLSDTSNMIV